MRTIKIVTSVALSLMVFAAAAQDKTIGNRKTSSAGTMEASPAAKFRVMLIPFEPKLYFGEIDRALHEETKLPAGDIRHRFRDGINEQLYRAFRASGFQTIDLMDDTAKYARDIASIYQFMAYDYLRVPDQANYKPPVRDKDQKKVDRGQLVVGTNSDARFMNARLTNPKIVPQLTAKYKTQLYVFVNQLDIRASGTQNAGTLTGNPNRRITVHYTVLTSDGRELNSGVAEEDFSPELNNPKKIVDRYFSSIATTIVKRVEKGLLAK